jgi:hypothetical protein
MEPGMRPSRAHLCLLETERDRIRRMCRPDAMRRADSYLKHDG